MKHWYIGAVCATLAAIFNATVGIFSVNLFSEGLSPQVVAFVKCLIALCLLLIYVLMFKRTELMSKLSTKWKEIFVCAFFGFFVLYTFETKAYETLNVAVVVFILFGSSTVTTFILACIVDKKMMSMKEALSMILSIIGLSLIFSNNSDIGSAQGIVSATISGVGYGVFLVLSKKLDIGSCIVTLTSLLGVGTLYLLIYLLVFPSSISADVIVQSFGYLTLLAILPTIGGFYCTIKALSMIKSQSVQLIELSEPIFAILFSFIFLSQIMTIEQSIGGVFIIVAILVHEVKIKSPLFKKS